jgi:hypothetical protein
MFINKNSCPLKPAFIDKKTSCRVNFFLKAIALISLVSPTGYTMASDFTTLAAKGNVTYTANGVRKKLNPGTPLSAGTTIQSGADGQAIIQLGSSFQVYQITSNTKACLLPTGLEKL